jgi:hypothetical protein
MNDLKMASELVAISKELAALDVKADFGDIPGVEQDQVSSLADKLLARLGPAKGRSLKTFGIELHPNNTVKDLAQAWATVLLGV